MATIYFEKRYCMKCVCEHWVEVTRAGQQICRGENFVPAESATHYVRHLGHGFELKPRRTLGAKAKARKDVTL